MLSISLTYDNWVLIRNSKAKYIIVSIGFCFSQLREEPLSKLMQKNMSVKDKKVTYLKTRFGGFNPILGPIFGFKRVGLALRIQKWVQSGRFDLQKGSNLGSTL
jgi:hypothetical protein